MHLKSEGSWLNYISPPAVVYKAPSMCRSLSDLLFLDSMQAYSKRFGDSSSRENVKKDIQSY